MSLPWLRIIVSGKSIREIVFHLGAALGGIARGIGYPLIWTYVAWLTLIIVSYPICQWYNN